MPKPVSLSFALGLPPADAVAYFESKGYKITFDWHELDQAAHAQAFTIAKMTSLSMQQDVRACLLRCLKEGKTEDWFRKQMEPYLREKGWWGKKAMVDPRTGEERKVQLGSPARLRLIYRQNLQTAFMAGRYKAMLENADARPWWQYVAVLDGRTRPSHRALAGSTFRYDDPFWSSHYPPNGFNCRCRVRALSDYRMEAEKVVPQSGVGNMVTETVTVPAADGQRLTRPVTGYKMPSGHVAFTDPGFSGNAGASWLGGALDELTRKLDAASPDLARAAVDAMTRGPVLGQWLAKPVGNFPLAVLPAEDAGLIGARAQVARLSPQTAGKQAAKHPELGPEDYQLVQEVVDNGERVQEGANKLHYILDQPGGMIVVVKATVEGDEVFVQSVIRLSAKDSRREKALRRVKKRKAPK